MAVTSFNNWNKNKNGGGASASSSSQVSSFNDWNSSGTKTNNVNTNSYSRNRTENSAERYKYLTERRAIVNGADAYTNLVNKYISGASDAYKNGTFSQDRADWNKQYNDLMSYADEIGKNYDQSWINSIKTALTNTYNSTNTIQQPLENTKANDQTQFIRSNSLMDNLNMVAKEKTKNDIAAYYSGIGDKTIANNLDNQELSDLISYYEKNNDSRKQKVSNILTNEADKTLEDVENEKNTYYWNRYSELSKQGYSEDEIDRTVNQEIADGYYNKSGRSPLISTSLYDNAITALQKELDTRRAMMPYASLYENADYENNSSYNNASYGYKGYHDASDGSRTSTTPSRNELNDDQKTQLFYDAVNGNSQALDMLTYARDMEGNMVEADPNVEKYMTKDEIANFNYLYATQGKEAAMKYYNLILDELNARYKEDFNAQIAKDAEDPLNAVAMSLWSVASAPMNAVSNLASMGYDLATTGNINYNDPKYTYANEASTMRSAVSNVIKNAAGGENTVAGQLAGIGYDTAMSILDNLYGIGTGSVISKALGLTGEIASKATEAVTLAIMGTTSAANSMYANISAGMDTTAAVTLGLGSGLIEVLTERIGLDNLFNSAWKGKSAWIDFAKQALSEGGEELVGAGMDDALGILYDTITGTSSSDFSREVNAYIIENGLAPNEIDTARSAVLQQHLVQYGIATFEGALSGGVMGGGAIGLTAINNSMELNDFANSVMGNQFSNRNNAADNSKVNSVINAVLKADHNTDAGRAAYDSAKALKLKSEYGYKITNKEAADLLKSAVKANIDLGYNYDSDINAEDTYTEPDATSDTAEQSNDNSTPEQVQQKQVSDNVTEQIRIIGDKFTGAASELFSNVLTNAIKQGNDMLKAAEAFNKVYMSEVKGTQSNVNTDIISADVQRAIRNQVAMDNINNEARARLETDDNVKEFQNTTLDNMVKSGFIDGRVSYGGVGSTFERTETESGVIADLKLAESIQNHAIDQTLIDDINKFAKAFKLRVQFVDSGLEANANGSYNRNTRSITLAIDSVFKAKNPDLNSILRATFGHELTHSLQDLSTEAYNVLTQEVRTAMRAEEFEKAINKNRILDPNLSRSGAIDEVIADFIGTEFFSDSNFADKLFGRLNTELPAEKHSVIQKIRDWIKNAIAALKGTKIDHKLEETINRLERVEESLKNLINEGTKAISESQRFNTNVYEAAAEGFTVGDKGHVTDVNGNVIALENEDGSTQFSLRTYEEDGKAYLDIKLKDLVKKNKLSQSDADDIRNSLDDIYRTCNEYKGKYAPFSNWSDAIVVSDEKGNPVFSVVKQNGDYSMNLDFSLVCKKRRALDAVINKMIQTGMIGDYKYDKEQIVKINNIIKEHGFEIACALCFVDAKRFRQGEVAGEFTNMYNTIVNSMIPDGKRAAYFNFGGNGTIENITDGIDTLPTQELNMDLINEIFEKNKGKAKKNWDVEMKIADYLKRNPSGRKLVDVGDFMSTAGFDNLKAQNEELLGLYNSKKGAAGPKASFSDVQYLNDIFKKGARWDVSKAYSVGGVRIQSFSDYVPRLVFDYTQMIADLAAKKLPAHAYTKESMFVKQFGLTGIKINMSLVPMVVDGGIAAGLDANGNYAWADESFGDYWVKDGKVEYKKPQNIEGWVKKTGGEIGFQIAMDIQNSKGYSRNCGTIAVGVSDEHIRKLMADPNIRMVIPYHKSGLNPIVAHMNRIEAFTDYTNFQNTRRAETLTKLDAKKPEDKKLINKEINFNKRLYDLSKNGKKADPKAVAEEYVRWCEDNGLVPKFDQFAYKEIDGVPAYDYDGNRAVDENYYKLLEDFTVYDNGEYVPQDGVRMEFPGSNAAFGSMSDLIAEGLEEDAITQAKLDAELDGDMPAILEEMRAALSNTNDNIVNITRNNEDAAIEEERSVVNSIRITDDDTLNFLENQEHVEVYRAMQIIDGKLYPPMTAYTKDENGKKVLRTPSEIGEWYQAIERPDMINSKGKFDLKKGKDDTGKDGTPVAAAYNPYFHSSLSMLNDQFTSAYKRSNLVVVRGIVPSSELTSGYKAQYAKDSVGMTSWHSGIVSGSLPETRKVMLSRYFKPLEILSNDVVAENVKKMIGDLDIEIPFNVVSPGLRRSLENIGVKIGEGQGLRDLPKKDDVFYSIRDSDGNSLTYAQQEYFKDSKVRDDNGNLKVMYHGTSRFGFSVFNPKWSDDKISLFFTDNKNVAKSYSGTIETVKIDNKDITYDELFEMYSNVTLGDEILMRKVGGYVLVDPLDEEIASFDSLKEAQTYFWDNTFDKWSQTPGNYPVYLNITNPLSIDAEYSKWNEIKYGNANLSETARPVIEYYEIMHGYDPYLSIGDITDTFGNAEGAVEYLMNEVQGNAEDDGISLEEAGLTPKDFERLTELAKIIDAEYEDWNPDDHKDEKFNDHIFSEYKKYSRTIKNTRQIAEDAKKKGYDGVIIKNLVDIGARGGTDDSSTIVIAFDSSQIKSVDNSNPTIDPDIRYSIRESELTDEMRAEIDNEAVTLLNINDANEKFTSWIASGYKDIETRKNKIKYNRDHKQYTLEVGDRVGIVSTGYNKTRGKLVAYATVKEIKPYANSESFDIDVTRHRVSFDSKYHISKSDNGFKYGYVLGDITPLDVPIPTIANGQGGTRTSDVIYSKRDENPIDYDKIVQNAECDDALEKSLSVTSDWRKRTTRIDGYSLAKYTRRLIDRNTEGISKDDKAKYVTKVNALAQSLIRDQKMTYENVKEKADKIASDIIFAQSEYADKDIKVLKESLQYDEKVANAVDALSRALVVNIVSTNTRETSNVLKNLRSEYEKGEKLRQELIDVKNKRIEEKKKWKESQEAKRAEKEERDERTKLLKLMNRLNNIAGNSLNGFIGDKTLKEFLSEFDLTSKAITSGKVNELVELSGWIDANPDLEILQSTKDRLHRLTRRHIDGQVTILGEYLTEEDALAAQTAFLEKAGDGIETSITITGTIANKDKRWVLKSVEGKMSIEEVRAITEALINLETAVRNENKLIQTEDKRSTQEIGEEIKLGVEQARPKQVKYVKTIDGALTEMLRPETEMLRLIGYDKNNALYKLTFGDSMSLATGQRTMLDYKRRANDGYFGKFLNDKDFCKSVYGKNARAIEITGRNEEGLPVTLKMTPDQTMAVYMHLQNQQNVKHIANTYDRVKTADGWKTIEHKAGGMTIPDFELYRKGKYEEAFREGTKIVTTRAEMVKATKNLTDKEMQFIRAAQRYYANMSQNEINAVSTLLHGVELAKVNNYWHINTDSDYRQPSFDVVKHDSSIESGGWTKDRVNASNPILLIGMIDQIQRDISEQSKYVGLAIPIRNLTKALGVTTRSYGGDGTINVAYTGSVMKSINKVWSKNATNYIGRMLADIQSPVSNNDFWGNILGKSRSYYAGSVLTVNAGVAIKQAASYPTAAAEIGWKPLIDAMVFGSRISYGKMDMNLVNKYSPLMRLRTEGISNQELGDMKKDGRDIPKLLNWIQGMDVATVKKLWKASEYYVKSNYKDIKPYTDEFYRKVGEVHSKVIEKTQPNYSALQRPQILRTKNELVKTLNMFKTQPFQNFNILYEAGANMITTYRAKKVNPTVENIAKHNAARKKVAWAVSSQLVSSFVFAVMQYAWDFARRKDDKYKEDGEWTVSSWLKQIAINMGTNAFGMIPFGSAIFEAVESIVDTALVNTGNEKFFEQKFYGIDAGTATDTLNDALETLISVVGNSIDMVSDIKKSQENGTEFDWLGYLRSTLSDATTLAKFKGVPGDNVINSATALAKWILQGVDGKYVGNYVATKIVEGVKSGNKSELINNLIQCREKEPDKFDDLYNMMVEDDLFGTSSQSSQEYIDKALEKYEKQHTANGITYAQQDRYDSIMDSLDDTSAYQKSSAEDQEEYGNIIEKYVTSSANWANKGAEGADAGAFTETEYILFMMATEKVNGEWDASPTVEEIKEAIDDIGWSDSKAKKAWEYLPTTAKNPYDTSSNKTSSSASKTNTKSTSTKNTATKQTTKTSDVSYKSDWVANVTYNPATKTLTMTTKAGYTYTHNNVDESVYNQMVNGDPGKTYNAYFK